MAILHRMKVFNAVKEQRGEEYLKCLLEYLESEYTLVQDEQQKCVIENLIMICMHM